MATLTGSGPKRVKLVYDGIRIRTLADLRDAAAAGYLRGFGSRAEDPCGSRAAHNSDCAERFRHH